MFCRCRYLRAYHLESLLLLPSTPTRRASRATSTSRTFSQSFTDSSLSHHDEACLLDKNGNVLDIDSLRGSIRSPLAFKPVKCDPFPLDEEADLEFDLEEDQLPPLTLHKEDPLFPHPRGIINPGPTNITQDAEDVEKLSFGDPWDPAASTWLPWDKYVEQLKAEKRRRQLGKAGIFRDPAHAIQIWDNMRRWSRVNLANLSVLQWNLLAKAGCLLSNPSVLGNLPRELVAVHANSAKAQASMVSRVLQSLVGVSKEGYAKDPLLGPLLRPWNSSYIEVSEAEATFHKNLDYLAIDLFSEYFRHKEALVAGLPRRVILRLAAIAAYRRPIALKHGGLLNAFFAAARLDGWKLTLAFPLRDPTPLNDAPPGHVWTLFHLVQTYINSESRREAFRLFQRLVKENIITPSAISQVNINREDPRTAILFAITKSCLDYEWNTGSLELMILAAERDPTVFDEQMMPLVNETLYVLLKQAASMSPAQKYNVRMSAAVQQHSTQRAPDGPKFLLRRIMALIAALRRGDRVFEIEDQVIQNFYAVARQLDFHHVAEALFSIGRIHSSSSLSTPLLLLSPSFGVSNGRSSGYLPVEPHRITYKTTLRHIPPSNPQPAPSKDSLDPLVTAKTQYPPPCGPPLLWLLETMLKDSKNVHFCRSLAKEVVELDIDIPVYDRGHFVRLLANAGLARAARDLWKRYSQDETQGVIGHAGAMMRLVSLFYRLGKDLEGKESIVDEDSEDFETLSDPDEVFDEEGAIVMEDIDGEDAKVLFDADAAKGFAREVVEKFRACKEPIQAASKLDLNALARAYFLMDRPEDGFSLFQIVKTTRSPDMYDVNVGLSGVAKYNAELASRMVDRMHERGLAPDAVTWGTLIHLAFLKSDMEMVISLVKRARQRGVSEFSSRTIGTLIRASLSDVPPGSQVPSYTSTFRSKEGVGPLQLTLGGEGSADQIRQNLGMAWHLIGTLDTRVFVGTWSLARFCLDRALWLGDAELAFKFWNKYSSSKTQWNDGAQVKYRKSISKLVVMAKDEQRLDASQAANMLRKLSGTSEVPVLL